MKNLFISFLFYIFTFSIFPHGGGLNSEGCHNNRKTGGYHCHRKKQETYKEKPQYEKNQNFYSRKYNRNKNLLRNFFITSFNNFFRFICKLITWIAK